MFEEFQEAAEKEEQKKKTRQLINIATAVLFSISILVYTLFSN